MVDLGRELDGEFPMQTSECVHYTFVDAHQLDYRRPVRRGRRPRRQRWRRRRLSRYRSERSAPRRRSRPPIRARTASATTLSSVNTTDTAAIVGVKP